MEKKAINKTPPHFKDEIHFHFGGFYCAIEGIESSLSWKTTHQFDIPLFKVVYIILQSLFYYLILAILILVLCFIYLYFELAI